MKKSTPNWSAEASHQRIALKDVRIRMRLGLTAEEKARPLGQEVLVNVEMYAHPASHGATQIAHCIDYHPIYRFITETWPERSHTELLEPLVEELIGLCFRDPRILACRASITKTEVYGGHGSPMVEFYRVR
jgi:7,8-dihydroneopterin aldolase/epimerase/oxygenase